MDDQKLSDFFDKLQLQDKELLSKLFQTFNNTIEKLRDYQKGLEDRVNYLTGELNVKNLENENILESLPHGLIVTDLKGDILSYNKSAEKILGKSREEVLNTNINNLLEKPILPELDNPDRLELISDDYSQELALERREGFNKQYLSTTTTTIGSEITEQGPAIIVNIRDITHVKRLEEEARRKNRLMAMGEIAANVAHEIRNPLGSIDLFVSTLKRDFQDNEEKLEIMHHIQTGIRSMNHIISNMLGYANPKPFSPSRLEIGALLRDFIGFSKHLAEHQEIKLNLSYEDEPIYVRGDQEMLRQVFHNLFTNGIQAMDNEGGEMSISLRKIVERVPSRQSLFTKHKPKNGSLEVTEITFWDSGKGMSEEVIKRLFDPFYTTKEKGTGLGMFIIRNIVESHGGIIEVDSEVGKGSTVSVLIPTMQV